MALPDRIGEYELTKLEVPTVFGLAAERVLAVSEELVPDAIICVGQAGGRGAVTPEVVGINLREASIPDNAGNRPVNLPVTEGGPAAYFSTLPVREMVAAIRDAGGEMIHYEELPGYGHNVWDYAASEAEVEGMGLIEWLFSHSLEG